MKIDHIHFYVDNVLQWRDWFSQVMGFVPVAQTRDGLTHTEVVTTGCGTRSPIYFLISAPLSAKSPVAQFLDCHPPGIADVALEVTDCADILRRSLDAGASAIHPLRVWQSEEGSAVWATIQAKGGLTHTLIQRHGMTPWLPDRLWQDYRRSPSTCPLFQGIDHLVLNVPAEEFGETIDWYQQAFGFELKQSFFIQTHRSGLSSQVLIHPQHGLQLPVNAPRGDRSQIEEFLTLNRGSGIQHIALRVSDITAVVAYLRQQGLSFLEIPESYYQCLCQQAISSYFSPKEWQAIAALKILVDRETQPSSADNNGDRPLLLQIFSEPIFAEPTFFFECIERRSQAQGFGEGNFQALFEAIERQQFQRLI